MENWVSATEFVEALREKTLSANEIICCRAAAGLVRAKAARVIINAKKGQQIFDGVELPTGFWWAKGRPSMKQDWGTGDFSCQYSEKGSLWSSKGISRLVAPPHGVADMLVEAFSVEFDQQGVAEICPQLSRSQEPDYTALSNGDEMKFFEALKCIRNQWTLEEAKAALVGLFPGRKMTRARITAGLKREQLDRSPGRPPNSPKSETAI